VQTKVYINIIISFVFETLYHGLLTSQTANFNIIHREDRKVFFGGFLSLSMNAIVYVT
jgi:hypothetical protein